MPFPAFKSACFHTLCPPIVPQIAQSIDFTNFVTFCIESSECKQQQVKKLLQAILLRQSNYF